MQVSPEHVGIAAGKEKEITIKCCQLVVFMT